MSRVYEQQALGEESVPADPGGQGSGRRMGGGWGRAREEGRGGAAWRQNLSFPLKPEKHLLPGPRELPAQSQQKRRRKRFTRNPASHSLSASGERVPGQVAAGRVTPQSLHQNPSAGPQAPGLNVNRVAVIMRNL